MRRCRQLQQSGTDGRKRRELGKSEEDDDGESGGEDGHNMDRSR